MTLDPITIILMSTLMDSAMSIVLFSAHRSFPTQVRGLADWALGLLLLVLSAGLFVLVHMVDSQLIIFGANLALLWGIGLSMTGTQKFYGRKPSWWLFHLLAACGMAILLRWYLVSPDFPLRVALMSLLMAAMYLVQLGVIVRHGERQSATWFFAALMLIQVVVVLVRALLAVTHNGLDLGLAKGAPFHSLYLAVTNFMTLLLSVGFVTVSTRRLQTILEQRSNLDPLTQALNRRGFDEHYLKEKARMRRARRPLAILSLDLDFFKQINDRHGHAAGDRVLVHLTRVARGALRETDSLARFGGEEFIVMLPDTALPRARMVAERIMQLVREQRNEPDERGAEVPAYTLSIGVACQLSPEDDLESLLLRADAALYQTKENGRDRIEVDPALALALVQAQG